MSPPSEAIVGVTALLGPGLEPTEDAVVVIDGGLIAAAGRPDDTPIPDGTEVVTGEGRTLVPGFIDAHVHIGFYDPVAVLHGGVTTVRDLGWPPARIDDLIRASRDDDFAGPAIFAAGPMLTAVGGYPSRAAWAPQGTAREISDIDDARTAATEVADAGYAIVKIALNPPVGPVLDADALRAIVEVAHERGLKVTGHIYGLDELDKALDAGVDELAHMLMSDEAIPEATIERMVSAGIVIVPTLSVFSGPALRTAIANLSAFHQAGGRVVYGTDLGNEGPRPGIEPNEIRAMARAGMSGADIVRSATVAAAEWLGLDTTGMIAPGYDADLVLIDGDPLEDPACLTRVERVWRKGIR